MNPSLTFHEFMEKAPMPTHMVSNRPLVKLSKTLDYHPAEWIPTTRQIGQYPHNTLIVGIYYGRPKVFMNNHRVWAFHGWRNQQNNNSTDWWFEISPSTVDSKHLKSLLYSFNLVTRLDTELRHINGNYS